MYAARYAHTDIVKILIENEADIHATDKVCGIFCELIMQFCYKIFRQ